MLFIIVTVVYEHHRIYSLISRYTVISEAFCCHWFFTWYFTSTFNTLLRLRERLLCEVAQRIFSVCWVNFIVYHVPMKGLNYRRRLFLLYIYFSRTPKGPHTLWVKLCSLTEKKKKLYEILNRFPIRFVSSVCFLLRVTMADENKAIFCCLLATSTIMLPEKKKRSVKCGVRSGIWKRKGRLSFIHFGRLNALRGCHRGVSSKTEETVGFPEWTELFCVWKTTGKDISEDCTIACENCAVYLVFLSSMTSHSKLCQFNPYPTAFPYGNAVG